MKLFATLKMVERLDQLIRLKSTGTPKKLAVRLGISERSVHRLIEMMKDMEAPIYYCIARQSYCYECDVEFRFGFYLKDSTPKELYGGTGKSFELFFQTARNWQ
ncbi:MAG: hypothetical protein AAGG75_03370 [Bacteroidota bacterium]